mmetsp:Transcript_13588/g.26032  ORF Transcript_13588/g.26032 Transcript_13588/m.26032 type:complete len:342 (-) Transcript_13588:128-1153(-)|eukprot:CAMPEP_0114312554 /NCGR_PEP_ID=MMETSP0059-20121206/20517_1 /TAXON_ID=36894 /ORGANISM="Pyramimonas parkeae, Strain CCMP726" /LENGTH=341 /DNA_ID=CAMNT_0001436997 /DNA_START=65 /DNA_END=1090 /DNA_ORIENTATION=-
MLDQVAASKWLDLPETLLVWLFEGESWARRDAGTFRLVCKAWRDAHDARLEHIQTAGPSQHAFDLLPGRFPQVTTLSLWRCDRDSKSLTEVEVEVGLINRPLLTHIDMGDMHLTNRGVHALSKILTLQTVKLSYLEIGGRFCKEEILDDGVEALSRLPCLHTLYLTRCRRISDLGVAALSRCKSLRTLCLVHCGSVTHQGIKPLVNLPSLQTLTLLHCEEVTTEGVMALAGQSALRTLRLTGCTRLEDAGVVALTSLTELRILDLSYCVQVTDVGVKSLAVLPSLHTLTLSMCKCVTDTGVKALQGMRSLRMLRLSGCSNVTAGLVHSLTIENPDIRVYRS